MAAIVQINEYNTSGETKTAGIANTNMGSIDAASLDPVEYPVTPGNNTFEKWQSIEVTDMGGSSRIDNLKIWRTGALGDAAVHDTNATESTYSEATFAEPIDADSTVATNAMPETEPAGANLGIAGSLTGALDAVGESDLLVHQIQTDAADTAGSTSTMNYQYDETA